MSVLFQESPRRVPDPHQAPLAPLAYNNPNYESQPPRTPSRVTFGHRRTPSGSSAGTATSFQYQDHGLDRVDRSREGPGSGDYNDRPPPMAPRRLSRQGSYGHEVRQESEIGTGCKWVGRKGKAEGKG